METTHYESIGQEILPCEVCSWMSLCSKSGATCKAYRIYCGSKEGKIETKYLKRFMLSKEETNRQDYLWQEVKRKKKCASPVPL